MPLTTKHLLLIDAGIERIHFRYIDPDGNIHRDVSMLHRGRLKDCLEREQALWSDDGAGRPKIYLTGKLSGEACHILGEGRRILKEALLTWAVQRMSEGRPGENPPQGKIAIIDFSASGYRVVMNDHILENTACGAGSGVNLRRILDKLDIAVEDVDDALAGYLGPDAASRRKDLPVRMERCGVFSVSATVSDKNQGIPTAHALAVTMKSEAAKPCGRIFEGVRTVWLTGGVFRWQFMRDCAADYLHAQGIADIRYDANESAMLTGLQALAASVQETSGQVSEPGRLYKKASDERSSDYFLPSFSSIHERLARGGRFVRLTGETADLRTTEELRDRPVNIALDMGSSMAKMVIADAESGAALHRDTLPNRGDTLLTLRRFLNTLRERGIEGLAVQNWGLTGSGRYQIEEIIRTVYPHLGERVVTMVENEAHALGSLDVLERHIIGLKAQGHTRVNEEVAFLVDIGGEDTKISAIAIKDRILTENAMNTKCSAGTGSLMDVLKDLLDIPDAAQAYRMAGEAAKAWKMNAACAVFLMEEAGKMQARGISTAEILASCCWAVVENMARTLWRQVNVLPHAVVLLHGQTMLSDPLALATVERLSLQSKGPLYGLVPPYPGHRACYGLLSRMTKDTPLLERCNWADLIDWSYQRRLFSCSGRVCGNERMRCTRTAITASLPDKNLSVTIGGCTSVNDRTGSVKDRRREVPDAYREIWQWLEDRHPKSRDDNRLVIPRCFSLSGESYRFAVCFEKMGIPVHADAVQVDDIHTGRPFFNLDTCAPNIGATGQAVRLAGEPHGLIFWPQIDFLPTNGAGLGRACTTNQGGIWAAVQHARRNHPDARFAVSSVNLGEKDPLAMTRRLFRSFREVFRHYNVSISLSAFRDLWLEAEEAHEALDREKADRAAGYLEAAAENDIPVTIVCGRDYVLNPGLFDNHISKILKDKGILPLPSYVFDTPQAPRFSHIYWKTAHDIVTKTAALAEGRLHEIVRHPRLKAAIRRLEQDGDRARLGHATVTTFHCGPDSVTSPLMQEYSKTCPSLWIQSDGAMAELAHLENRISTHLRRLETVRKKRTTRAGEAFRIEALTEFNLDVLNPETDVVYFPTMGDNRILSALVRSMGITSVDTYTPDGYDLERIGRKGRQYVGDAVCLPLAAVFADMLESVDHFKTKKEEDDPLFRGKSRIVLFMHGGDGPCRLGQYIQVFKLAFHLALNGKEPPGELSLPGRHDSANIRFIENVSSSLVGKNDCTIAFEPWVGILGYQGVILQGLLYSMLLKGASLCRDEASFRSLLADYRSLKERINHHIEFKARPNPAARKFVNLVSQYRPAWLGPAKFVGYGIWNNFGLRRYIRDFARRWILPDNGRVNVKKMLRIHVDGEVYVRTSQAEAILQMLTDYLGYGTFEMTLTPTWCFLEAVLFTRHLDTQVSLKDLDQEKQGGLTEAYAGPLAAERNRLNAISRETLKTIDQMRDLLARPLYEAAGIVMPHDMRDIYRAAEPIIPTGKPYGELVPFVGEAVLKSGEGVDLILNVAPEACMVSGMGDMLIPSIRAHGGNGQGTAIISLCTREGEIREDRLRLALLQALGTRWTGILPLDSP
jgi:activator of 2-hydroxyglutaryl-CoA dehydratase